MNDIFRGKLIGSNGTFYSITKFAMAIEKLQKITYLDINLG